MVWEWLKVPISVSPLGSLICIFVVGRLWSTFGCWTAEVNFTFDVDGAEFIALCIDNVGEEVLTLINK